MSDVTPPKQPAQRITPRALLELKRLESVQLHPDGRRVAFTVAEADFEESVLLSHIWITEWNPPDAEETETLAESNAEADAAKEEPDWTRQLTYSREGETSPRWSPNGESLAFLSTRHDPTANRDDDDDAEVQVWALSIDGGEARKITSAPEGVIDFAWAPDSESIVYLTPEPRPRPVESRRKEERNTQRIDPTVEHEEFLRRQLWSIGTNEGKPKYLGATLPGADEFALSWNGERIAYATNYTGEPNDYHADVYIRDLSTGRDYKLLKRQGSKYRLRWSPDDKYLAFCSPLDPKHSFSQETLFVCEVPESAPEDYACVYSAEAEGLAEARLVSQPDNDVLDYAWSATEGEILALCAVGIDTEMFALHVEGEHRRVDLGAGGERSSLSVACEGGACAFLYENHERLPEVYLRTAEGDIHPLTRLNREFAETYRLPRYEVVQWNSADGLRIEGVLVSPLDVAEGTPAPLIVQVHGGPKGRVIRSLRSYYMSPVWASEGYAVLLPNFRGSEGYGAAFTVSNYRDIGGGDFADVMAGADYCIERGIADPQRLGIMGGSYGGFMTNWAIGHTDRFRAAISMFGIFHLQTDYSASDFSQWDRDYLGGWYWEDPEIYRRLSPGSYVENIQTPTLILHGDDDNNTALVNSKEMYQALRHRGVTTQFVHYPREGHGVREPNHKLDEMRRCLAWMDRHLLSGGATPTTHRLNDRVISADGERELCVLRCEAAALEGRPAASKEESHALWELEFTFHYRERDAARPAVQFSLAQVRLKPSAGGEAVAPVGVPLKAIGGALLLEGEGLRFTVEPDAKTGELSFGCVVVFRLPKAGGSYAVRIADFAPVALEIPHSAEEDEEAA